MKKYRPRTYYTETDKAKMWDRWAKGESLHSIARLFDRHHPSMKYPQRVDSLIKVTLAT